MKIKWLTREEVRAYATTPARALDISTKHHQQIVDATEKELPAHSFKTSALASDLCGLCWYYRDNHNGGCGACPLKEDSLNCYDSDSLYGKALCAYKIGTFKEFKLAETALLNRLKQLKSGDKSMKKEEIEIRIKQNDADQERLRDEAEALKQQLAEEEVTYSIGDRFKCGGTKYILIWTGSGRNKVMLANLGDGWCYHEPEGVEDKLCITAREFEKISSLGGSEFTRYWDARKKVRCG